MCFCCQEARVSTKCDRDKEDQTADPTIARTLNQAPNCTKRLIELNIPSKEWLRMVFPVNVQINKYNDHKEK